MAPATYIFLALCAVSASATSPLQDAKLVARAQDGDFQNPPVTARPRFRYWLPDSSVPPEVVKEDIRSTAHLGAGGIELLPFFQYGGGVGPMPAGADWATSNFGTPQFLTVFQAALEAHKETGLKMDLAMGPNQGQGVPASTEDEGLQWDLVPFTAAAPKDEDANSTIVGWGTGDLVSLVSAEVLSVQTKSYTVASNPFQIINVTYDEYILKSNTLVEHTDSVDRSTGKLFKGLPPATSGSPRQIFTFYQKLTLNKNLEFPIAQANTIFDNGSFIVDHYSAKGAETVARFWEKYILTDEIRALISEVGNYGWEDSVEMKSNISWSPSLPERFERLMGYGIHPFLPLFSFGQRAFGEQTDDPGHFRCFLDAEDGGAGYLNDYHLALQDGYREYLQSLTNWTNSVLGIRFSAQPSYNLPMDMFATIPDVDVPECESLGFSDSIDEYLQFSGPANLAGKNVISNELGAAAGGAFKYPVRGLLFSANRGFAGGVNQYVIHGQAYSGNYYATTWPGYVPWQYAVAESWNNKEPVWDHGFEDGISYMSRTQHILQTGVAKTDVAVLWKQSATVLAPAYNLTNLTKAGWTYTYISTENFKLPQAVVVNGILAPQGPAWKVLVVYSSQNLSVPAVEKLVEYADAGLPLLFVDGAPGYYPTRDGREPAEFDKQLATLKTHRNVHFTSAGNLLSALTSLGIAPRIATRTNGTVYTAWRESTADSAEYAFLLSDTAASSGEITVQTVKTPYWLNAWTGERSPVLAYRQDKSTTTITLDLRSDQTMLLAFSDDFSADVATPTFHITSSPSNVLGYKYKKNCSGVLAKVKASADTGTVTTSTGKQISISSVEVPAPFSLGNWTLVAEHWEAPANFSDGSDIGTKRNTTHSLDQLVSWIEIPGLTNTSGVGYYSTSFTWPPVGAPSTSRLGAYLSLGSLLNTARLYVNGKRMPALDITDATVDISKQLTKGTNQVLVEVPTVMWNYLRTILPDILNAGVTPLIINFLGAAGSDALAAVDVGLVGDVVVTPFKVVQIKG